MSTTTETIDQRVQRAIAETLGVDQSTVTVDKHFEHDLGCDSLDCIELGMAVEDEFGIELPDEDLEKARTVGGLTDLARRYIPAPEDQRS